MPSPTGMQIYDPQGHRLYLTGSERAAFRTAAEAAPREVRTYCWTLLYTRLSPLGGPGAHRRSGGFPGGGPHL